MTYRDLNIHQRINAKGNKVSFSPKIERLRGNLLRRIVIRGNGIEYYVPDKPLYAIHVKHNNYDLPANYNPHK